MNQFKQPLPPVERVIREAECRRLTGICRTTRYMMEKEGKFPSRRKLGGRAVGWLLSEVSAWLRSCSKSA
ncbi:TPA: helix-turn-helix transcriptional regulator [Klebsiella quasipneumoniae subsp. similipneumoniae]|uniref:AlpA family phage regulatory protein n=1 Tax=Klebsiella quasipneumoniae subsp. similipneumoniae TaxID=1463164 RepID=A0AAE4MY68_9ENTR|nr:MULTISPECIES: AlpA family phage regulatory protein [Klebsiella]MCS5771162.1 AlpA family phage regulatory protein [Klebsiella variicola subsp. variicola]MBL3233412.1 AlpA family phage regulatory protein [Klebsiella pneumoniae]MBL3466218.1 AlpA family phage regulatory protein [Klebsiella pneumoniae]MBR7414448.1 AlpA family phage regulatory protein [Klebsiella quasipneumoniae]MCQ0523429.1 AlpA family phage regulatory protein [Klebsiella pneumoniae]